MVVPRTQFREEEVFEPQRILEKEGAEVVVASTASGTCRGMREGIIEATIALADAGSADYDALVIAGGASVPELFWKDKKLAELAAAMAAENKVVAAISLSTVVLARAKILEGRNATVYHLPEALEELKSNGAIYVKDKVVVEGKVITAEGPGEARGFSNAIVGALAG
jgi:protease I